MKFELIDDDDDDGIAYIYILWLRK